MDRRRPLAKRPGDRGDQPTARGRVSRFGRRLAAASADRGRPGGGDGGPSVGGALGQRPVHRPQSAGRPGASGPD
ncbi:MAG: hypothetical protein B7Z44_16650 [Caulobacter sp. 12-67-6]|nr:MAG: hypothetical protein B7Z44_16650 [Caulobacter sp. 12-67-6]OYX74267.1 MAG: hypothetical protein B7Y81_00665 [Caulobacter sp. 32-67-35]